jgi:hypothetical protein
VSDLFAAANRQALEAALADVDALLAHATRVRAAVAAALADGCQPLDLPTLDIDKDTLSVQQAAAASKISEDAMRKRIRARPEIAVRSSGRVRVLKRFLITTY